MLVIFGGTAAYHLKLADFATIGEQRTLATPYGESALFTHLTTPDGATVWFSSRHGEGKLQRTAAFVNHRANIWAARELGAEGILSWNGVGAIAAGLAVGQLVVPDDVLDMTRGRVGSFQEPHPRLLSRGRGVEIEEGEASLRPYANATGDVGEGLAPASKLSYSPLSAEAFSPTLRAALIKACGQSGLPFATHGTYVCTEGPRLETAAEIAMFGWGGAAVVGMTLVPEVWLARESGLPYASLCIITNMATGRWALDPRRDFGPGVGVTGLRVTLRSLTIT